MFSAVLVLGFLLSLSMFANYMLFLENKELIKEKHNLEIIHNKEINKRRIYKKYSDHRKKEKKELIILTWRMKKLIKDFRPFRKKIAKKYENNTNAL